MTLNESNCKQSILTRKCMLLLQRSERITSPLIHMFLCALLFVYFDTIFFFLYVSLSKCKIVFFLKCFFEFCSVFYVCFHVAYCRCYCHCLCCQNNLCVVFVRDHYIFLCHIYALLCTFYVFNNVFSLQLNIFMITC